jgi:hypothetical protein
LHLRGVAHGIRLNASTCHLTYCSKNITHNSF